MSRWEEIQGKQTQLFDAKELAKIGCHGCVGCADCCKGMGDSVWIDPYDTYQICKNLNQPMGELVGSVFELHVEDGLILPNIWMKDGKCPFLNAQDRCEIHAFRPGLCRLFPLGRNYDAQGISYFVLEDECSVRNRTKEKVQKWIGIADYAAYERYLLVWHELTKQLRALFQKNTLSEEEMKQKNMDFLKCFYFQPYTSDDFYTEFEARRKFFWQLLKDNM